MGETLHELKRFVLHRPPVSSATTTKRHLFPAPCTSVPSGLWLCCRRCRPRVLLLWDPRRTSTRTARLCQLPIELHGIVGVLMQAHLCIVHRRRRWDAPTSLASVLSSAIARVRNRPECGQTALWRPLVSFRAPHSQTASATASGNLNLSRIKVRKSPAQL